MSNFATLLEELAAEEALLVKGMGPKGDEDDESIRAMAEDSDADQDGVPDADDDEANPDEEDEDEDEGEVFGKSMTVQLGNGSTVEAYDGTRIVSQLIEEQRKLRDGTGEVMGQVVSLVKAMREQIVGQHKEIARLSKSLRDLSAAPRERKSALSITDLGQDKAGVESDASNIRETILAKADQAFKDKQLSGLEYNAIDVALRRNEAPNAAILRKIGM